MQDIPRELINQAMRGDMTAFESIYRLTSGFVYTVALRITNHPESAQDVTQEVFIKIFKNLKHFQFRSSLKTWIYRIAANSAINAYRKQRRDNARQKPFEDNLDYSPATGPSAPETANQQDEYKTAIESLLLKLNADQRACIVLREIEGLNYKEIAEALRININTVRSRIKRGRAALMSFARKGVIYNDLQTYSGIHPNRL